MRTPEQLRNDIQAEKSAKDHARLRALNARLRTAVFAGALFALLLSIIAGNHNGWSLLGVIVIGAFVSGAIEWFRLGAFAGIVVYGVPLVAFNWIVGPVNFFVWLGFLCGGAMLGLWFENKRSMT